jgi:hypothetical protein
MSLGGKPKLLDHRVTSQGRCWSLHQGARGSKILLVDAIAEKLDTKLSKWKPETSKEVRALVSDVIDAADNDALDLLRSRAVEQEVLDQLDEPTSR